MKKISWKYRTITILLGLGLAMTTTPTFASHPEVSLTGSNFEIDTDANIKVDDPAPSSDWANVTETRKADAPSGNGDNSFGQGSKEDTAVPSVVSGSIPPNKSDLKAFGVYAEKTATKSFIHLFWSRVQDPSGTTNMDFELNKLSTLSSNGVTPVRSVGDLLITYDLSQGGTNPVLSLRTWNGSAWGAATPTATTIDSRNIPYATSLIYRLARIEFTNGTLSIRQAEVIRQALKELIALGPAAVPAIRKFLLGFENVAFENLVGGNLLEYPTLRLALLDVLGKIGGSDAERVLHGQLEATAEPVEIAALARTLERLAPGQYREPILHATQELLAQISNELLSSEGELINVDTAPLFTVLQKYGDETVVAELEKVPPWLQQYATVTLANLAGGEGIQYLARMSSNPTTLQSEGGRLALQMLTQVAVDNLEAQEALFDTVSTDQIPASMWPRLAEVLAGNSQVQLQKPDEKTLALLGSTGKNPYSTNTIVDRQTQVLYSVNTSAVLTDPEIDHRLALIDRLMEETADPAAIQALEKARSSLQLSGHRLG